jgi:hypothetical protein
MSCKYCLEDLSAPCKQCGGVMADEFKALQDKLASCELDAARYRWLRDDNAYAPEEDMVRGGPELDRLCDEAIAGKR